MKSNFFRIFLLVSTLTPILSLSQTTTFNYVSTNLGTNCNVFSPSVNVSSVAHVSRAGGVSYSSFYGLQLSTIPTGPNSGGTAFYINYTFTAGYTYTIAVTAKGNPALSLKTSVVPNLNQFTTNSTSSCTPDPNVNGYANYGTGNLSTTTTTSYATYTTSSFSGSGESYLIVSASGGQSNFSLDVLSISQIVITKTSTGPSFTLPSTTNVQCSSPVNFTVTTASNPNNLAITDYTWNLGATPNGWLYNGSPAPQTVSTGSVASISLTPNSGTLSSISATVTAGGNNYNTNTSTISLIAPSLSITGNSSFCSDDTYSINLPSNASVIWSASPAGVVTLTGSGSQVTATKVNNGGTFNLTATVTACGNTYTETKSGIISGNLIDGSYSTSYDGGGPLVKYPQEGYNYITEYSYIWAYVYGSPTWSIVDGTISSWNYNGYNLEFYLSPGDWATFRATVTSGGCTSSQDFTFIAQSYLYYSLAPNPASSELTVYVDDEKLKKQKITKSSDQVIQQVIIMDKFGNMVLRRTYASDTKKATLNVSGLSPDMYVAKVFNGKKWTSIKFIKK